MPEKDKKRIKPVPREKPEIGIDTNNTFPDSLLDAAMASSLDTGVLENFSTVAQTREQVYSLIDTMAQDSTLNAVIESYAEDATEPNDRGKIIWAESKDNDEKVSGYVNYLLESLNIDKYIYSWAFSLVKYGDVYLQLYRHSDYGEDLLFGDSKNKKQEQLNESLNDADDEFGRYVEPKEPEVKENLKESVILKTNSKNDPYVHYVKMVNNPGEMFELTKFGKTVGYIKAPTIVQGTYDKVASLNRYLRMNKKDVIIYGATDFVHGCLDDNSNRVPEEVNIYLDDNVNEVDKNDYKNIATYTVRRGQSLLYNQFKTWRELTLLENSVLLSRLTRSSINRVFQVEVGDMPKAKVRSHIAQLKNLFEQKAALNKNQSYQEYTNPGPMENLVILPVHEGKGHIEKFEMGGEVDPKQLTDLSWFQDKLFGGLRVPKQFFGVTDDAAGFSGGESLAIISSKYAKAVKRVQNTLCQMITDLINLFLYDKGIIDYINKFTIRVQAPVTKDEETKRQNNDNRIRYVGDVMQQFDNVDDPVFKLKMQKLLLAPVINDDAVLSLIQEKITELEEENKEQTPEDREEETDLNDLSNEEPSEPTPLPEFNPGEEEPTFEETEIEENPTPEVEEDSYLPNPEELGIDMTQNK